MAAHARTVAVEDEKDLQSSRKRSRMEDTDQKERAISSFSYVQVFRTWLHLLKFNLDDSSDRRISWRDWKREDLYGKLNEEMPDAEVLRIKEEFETKGGPPSFPLDACLTTKLKPAATSRFRGKQEKRVRKGIIGVKNVNVMAYHIPCRVYHGVPAPGDTCSHICHNHHCVNPYHLCWETHLLNNMRNTCAVMQKAYAATGQAKHVCIHKPTCSGCTPHGDAEKVREWLVQNDADLYKRVQ